MKASLKSIQFKFAVMAAVPMFLTLALLGACTPSGQGGPASRPAPKGEITWGDPGPTTPRGTGDGGGGNTFRGRPLESYVVKVETLPAYLNLVRRKLDQVFMTGGDQAQLIKSVLAKNWYFIPAELSLIPKERIGSLVETEQAAKHTFKDVWVNKNIFAKMAEADQAMLIVHEIFVGIRLLSLDSSFNECLAFAPKIHFCDGYNKSSRGTYDDLKPEDMNDIRSATTEFMAFTGVYDHDAFGDFISRHHFKLMSGTFHLFEDHIKLSQADLTEMLTTVKALKSFPKVGQLFGQTKGPLEKCPIEMTVLPPISGEKTLVKLTMNRGQPGDFEKDFSIQGGTESIAIRSQDGTSSRFVIHLFNPDELLGPVGKESMSASMTFNVDHDLDEVVIKKMVCVKMSADGKHCESLQTPTDAFTYQCRQEDYKD